MKLSYTIPCSNEYLSEVRSFVRNHLVQVNVPEMELNQVVLAVDEACANAIIHGNAGDPSCEIALEMEINAHRINVEISDIGSFRPNETNWANFSMAEHVRRQSKGGLGRFLMHRIMDSVNYYRRGQTNVCALSKQFH